MDQAWRHLVRSKSAKMSKQNTDGRTLAFIGGGNMAEAFIAGLVKTNSRTAAEITVSDISEQRRILLAERFGIRTFAENAAAAKNAFVVALAVKPQFMAKAAASLKGALLPEALVISIAAGVPTTAIEHWLGNGARVIRVMPNTPALVGSGMHVWCRGKLANDDDAHTARTLLNAVGKTLEVEENLLDAATALSGSGPAYVFYLAEAMLQAGIEMGFSPEASRLLTAATIEGAGRMLTETKDAPHELRKRVTSKGGTTAAAAAILDQTGVRQALIKAIRAAENRARELSTDHARQA